MSGTNSADTQPRLQDKAPSATFCVVPWIERHTDEQGFHKLCCVAAGPGNFLRNNQGERLHVFQDLATEDVLNSVESKAARQQMIHGEWPAACERCKQAEAAGSVSVRQELNSRLGGDTHDLLRRTNPDGTLDRPVVRYADIRLGSVCNLTCRMCGPQSSRLWAPYFNDVQPASYQLPPVALHVLGENNWVKPPPLVALLDQCLPTVEKLHFAGGEPLMVPELVDALEQCIASGRAGEIELSFNTNLTVLPERVTALWPHFRRLTMLVSVDGFGRLNDYIRRPSHWEDIDRNLHTLDRYAREWKIAWCSVSATVQIYNVLSIRELYTYTRNAGFRLITPIPQLVPLFDPRYLSIQALPTEVKATARERLLAEIKRAELWNRPDLQTQIGSARSTIAFMDAADTVGADLPDFFSFCKSSDRAFGDSWRDASPELAELLEPAFHVR